MWVSMFDFKCKHFFEIIYLNECGNSKKWLEMVIITKYNILFYNENLICILYQIYKLIDNQINQKLNMIEHDIVYSAWF